MMGTHGPVIAVGPTSLLSALLRLKPNRSISETTTEKKGAAAIALFFTLAVLPPHANVVGYKYYAMQPVRLS